MALIDGNNIFGVLTTTVVVNNPRAVQTNSYPGLNGLEELDQGMRGRHITVTGMLLANSKPDMGFFEDVIRSYDDGFTHIFVDQFGDVLTDVKLESFEPEGRVQLSSDLNGNGPCYFRRYVARFRSLT